MDTIAAPSAAGGGGTAAALAGGMAAALVEMVAGLTARREKYAAVHPDAEAAGQRAAVLRDEFLALASEDAAAFAAFERALALPRGSEAERTARDEARRAALGEGARIQSELMHRTAMVAELAGHLTVRGLASAGGDAATAVFLAGAVARSAYWAIRSNLAGDTGRSQEMIVEAGAMLERVERAEELALRTLQGRIG